GLSASAHQICRNSTDAAASIVVDKATVFTASANVIIENGDSSKPYRHIPLFFSDPGKPDDIVSRIQPGQSINAVNQYRLPIDLFEQVPTNRQRYAVTGLLAHRFSSSTLREEERLYTDSWGLKASTTELLYFIDIGERLRVWPQARFNIQSGATFWRLAYPGQPVAGDPSHYKVPDIR